MSAYSVDELVQRVEARIDEVTPVGQTPTVSTAGIRPELLEASTQMFRTIPREMVFPVASTLGAPVVQDVVSGDETIGLRIEMPANFLRFLRCHLASWTRPMDDAISTNSNEYRAQFNKYQRASGSRPVVALVPASGGTAIEAFPHGGINQVLIVEAYPSVENLAASLPTNFVDPLLWMTASRVLNNLRQYDASQAAAAMYANVLSQVRIGLKGEDIPTT